MKVYSAMAIWLVSPRGPGVLPTSLLVEWAAGLAAGAQNPNVVDWTGRLSDLPGREVASPGC